MKKLKTNIFIAIILTLSSVGFSSNLFANDIFLTICKNIKDNNPKALKRTLKNDKLKIRNLPKTFMCNGKDIFEWALHNKAYSVAELIVSKQTKKKVKELNYLSKAETSGNADVLAKVNKRIN
jgi:hypothetical protein